MKKFDKLPEQFKSDEVRPYYDILRKKKGSLVLKRVFDIFVALIMLGFLIVPIIVLSVIVCSRIAYALLPPGGIILV